jgi:hypothetical protein
VAAKFLFFCWVSRVFTKRHIGNLQLIDCR